MKGTPVVGNGAVGCGLVTVRPAADAGRRATGGLPLLSLPCDQRYPAESDAAGSTWSGGTSGMGHRIRDTGRRVVWSYRCGQRRSVVVNLSGDSECGHPSRG